MSVKGQIQQDNNVSPLSSWDVLVQGTHAMHAARIKRVFSQWLLKCVLSGMYFPANSYQPTTKVQGNHWLMEDLWISKQSQHWLPDCYLIYPWSIPTD